jgi:hypothetical protein
MVARLDGDSYRQKAKWRGNRRAIRRLETRIKRGFFYNFNVKVTGAARLCRA